MVALVSLGAWQLRRAEEKSASQAAADAAARSAPLLIDGAASAFDGLDGRHVEVVGEFVASRTLFLDNRTHQGVAGFHVITPLRVRGTRHEVLVLRGWIAGDPAHRGVAPSVPTPAGLQRVVGTATDELPMPFVVGRIPAPGPSDHVWQTFTPALYAAWSGSDRPGPVVRQSSPADDGLVRDWPRAGDMAARHRGYAVQWFAMAAFALAGWIWLARRRVPVTRASGRKP